MLRRRSLLGAGAAVLALVATQPAEAKDPGRWNETGRSTVPLNYYQGVASDPGRRIFFNGVYTGLYRTDANLNEQARNDNVFPPDVFARERYNHIGDIAWDAREGGRILLPTECYYPQSAPSQEDENNPCNNGSIAVADPDTLAWRYYVKLDPAEIPKVMWVAVSPDGKLVWTQSHDDLLAYSMDDISPAHAQPAAAPVKAVRKLPKAVPPSGITGAVFYGGRLYVAGGEPPDPFQVWSIDVATGARVLEIEKPKVTGESEGIDIFAGLGGVLHWLIEPYNTRGEPTYGFANGTLLNFVPKKPAAGGPKGPIGPPAKAAQIHLTVKPKHIPYDERTKLHFRATARVAGSFGPVDGATVRIGRKRGTTGEDGRVAIAFRSDRAGTRRATARRPGLRQGKVWLRVMKPGR